MGKVLRIFPRTDAHLPVAKIKVGAKEYTRPISKLNPLEFDEH